MQNPTSPTREQEAKFNLPATQSARIQTEMQQHTPPFLEGYTLQSLGTVKQTDTYLDTPIYDLLRHGLALRVRHNGANYEVGIKGIEATRKGAIQERIDIVIPLPPETAAFDPTTWPNSVADQLAPYHVTLEKIQKLLVIHQRRNKSHIIQTENNTSLAELSLDEVWIVTGMDDEDANAENFELFAKSAQEIVPHTQDSTHFWEIEIERLNTLPQAEDREENKAENEAENKATDIADLAFTTLVQKLQKQYSLISVYDSKFLRGLSAILAQAHNGHASLTPTMSLEAAGQLLLHQQLLIILLNEHGVRYGKKAKYVHDMRVAIRRARAALHLCEDIFPAKEIARQQKALKRLGKALGAVRDLDVVLANLSTFRRSQPTTMHKGIKLLRGELNTRRANAQVHLWALLESKKHDKFIRQLHKFCTKPASATQQASGLSLIEWIPTQVRHTLPSIILRAYENVRVYEVPLNASERPPLETFHALRIQAKYLRYLLEFVAPLLGDEGKRVIAQLRSLQEHLGKLNDAHVEQARLHTWLEKLQNDPHLAQAITTRLDMVSQRIDELAATAPARLNHFVAPQNRHLLANALASL